MYTHVIRKACAVSVVCPGVRDSVSGDATDAADAGDAADVGDVGQLAVPPSTDSHFNLPKNVSKIVIPLAFRFTRAVVIRPSFSI